MPSLQRPKKIIFVGENGKEYPFLVKPHDDLRKDARLMDFNSMINKLLKSRSETRRRNMCKSIPFHSSTFLLMQRGCRYPHLCCYAFERRVRNARMGVQHGATTKHPHQRIRTSRRQDLCKIASLPHRTDPHNSICTFLVYRNLRLAGRSSSSRIPRISKGFPRFGIAPISSLRLS